MSNAATAALSEPRAISPAFLRVKQLEARWNVPRPTIYQWIEQKMLGHTKLGSCILVPIAEVERFEAADYVAPVPGRMSDAEIAGVIWEHSAERRKAPN